LAGIAVVRDLAHKVALPGAVFVSTGPRACNGRITSRMFAFGMPKRSMILASCGSHWRVWHRAPEAALLRRARHSDNLCHSLILRFHARMGKTYEEKYTNCCFSGPAT
jgi:hypothetical protein